MTHLFKQIYVNDIDFEAMTAEKLIGLVFTEIYQLEEASLSKRDETDGNQWTRFRKRFEVLDEEERWIRYAEHALELLNHDVMWQGIIEACKILKYLELSEVHALWTYVLCHVLFGIKCFPKLKEHCLLLYS